GARGHARASHACRPHSDPHPPPTRRSSGLRQCAIARGAAKHPLRVRTIEAGTHDFTREPRSERAFYYERADLKGVLRSRLKVGNIRMTRSLERACVYIYFKHQDKIVGESVRLQSLLNIVMLTAPMCGSTRRSEAPPSSSYDRSRYPRPHTRTTIGACFLLLACRLEGGPPFPTESREHQDDKVFGESVRLQSQ